MGIMEKKPKDEKIFSSVIRYMYNRRNACMTFKIMI